MSHSNSALKNKQPKHPKVFFEQYLYDAHEPYSDILNDTQAAFEVDLLEDSYNMRRKFRRVARRLRNRYS